MSMTPHKRSAQGDNNEDDVAAEAGQRAHPATVRAPSNPPPAALATATAAAAAFSSFLRLTAEQLQSTVSHVAGIMRTVLSRPAPSLASSVEAAPPQPAAAAAPAAPTACSSSPPQAPAAETLLVPPVGMEPFGILADIEVQLIMQLLDQQSLLRLARCSRALFRCASNPFAWQRLRFQVDVRGSEVIEDPRRAGSLLRFAPSSAYVDEHASDSRSLVSCATLLRVPQLFSVIFQRSFHPLMQLDEWHAFLQHPSAQRLKDVHFWIQPSLCDTASLSLLSQLPLLHSLTLSLPAAASAGLVPLVNAPSLTDIDVLGPMGTSTLAAPLEPLAQCTRLRKLGLQHLTLRAGQLSELLIQLAQAGGRLQLLRLVNLRMLPMKDSVVDAVAATESADMLDSELIVAASSLTHLRTLWFYGISSVNCMLCLPSLRMLELSLELLPPATKLELLLRRLPHLRCVIRYRPDRHPGYQVYQHNATILPQLIQLMQQCPRFTIKELV
jgi:hypothetical protein